MQTHSRIGVFIGLLAVILIARFLIFPSPKPPPKEIEKPWDLIALLNGIAPNKISTNLTGEAILKSVEKSGAIPFSPTTDASTWRQMDREHRFERVALLGPTAEYGILLSHLIESPDWSLMGMDGWGFVFQRGDSKSFDPPAPESIGKDWDTANRINWLSRYAANLIAMNRLSQAKLYIEEAKSIDPKSSLPYSVDASLLFQQHLYAEALAAAQQALGNDHRSQIAQQIEIRSLLELRRFEEAYEKAQIMVDTFGDFNSLIIGAQVAHAVHAYGTEVDWLERAIAISKKIKGAIGGMQILLGQAYAKQGFIPQSIQAFEAALQSTDLTQEQRREVESTLKTIRSNSPNGGS